MSRKGEIIRCSVCNKLFTTTSYNQSYCSSQCRTKMRNDMFKKEFGRQDINGKPSKIKPVHRSNQEEISRLNFEGFLLGLSYGQYVAMTEYGARYECIERSKT